MKQVKMFLLMVAMLAAEMSVSGKALAATVNVKWRQRGTHPGMPITEDGRPKWMIETIDLERNQLVFSYVDDDPERAKPQQEEVAQFKGEDYIQDTSLFETINEAWQAAYSVSRYWATEWTELHREGDLVWYEGGGLSEWLQGNSTGKLFYFLRFDDGATSLVPSKNTFWNDEIDYGECLTEFKAQGENPKRTVCKASYSMDGEITYRLSVAYNEWEGEPKEDPEKEPEAEPGTEGVAEDDKRSDSGTAGDVKVDEAKSGSVKGSPAAEESKTKEVFEATEETKARAGSEESTVKLAQAEMRYSTSKGTADTADDDTSNQGAVAVVTTRSGNNEVTVIRRGKDNQEANEDAVAESSDNLGDGANIATKGSDENETIEVPELGDGEQGQLKWWMIPVMGLLTLGILVWWVFPIVARRRKTEEDE